MWDMGFTKTTPVQPTIWVIKVWVDVSHDVCPKTRRSHTGFSTITLNDNLLSYRSRLQPGVPSQSSSGAEYRGLSDALNEVIWIVMLLREIGLKVATPIEFCEDNQAAIKLGQNKMASARSKHIELKHQPRHPLPQRQRYNLTHLLSNFQNDCRHVNEVPSTISVRAPAVPSNDRRDHRRQ